MTDSIIERCAGDMDRARCDGLKPAYWHMTQEMANRLKLDVKSHVPLRYGLFMGLYVHPVSGLPKGKTDPMLVASGTPDTAQSLLEEAGDLIQQCADTDAVEEKLYADLHHWLRRYNKQKEQG